MGIAVEFLPVGDSDGDAILIQYGDDSGYKLTLVDGGYAQNGESSSTSSSTTAAM